MRLHTLHTTTTDPRARGIVVGERFAPEVRHTVAGYLEHFRLLGIASGHVRDIVDRSHAALREWAPDLAAESDAIADAAHLEPWQVAAVGARTEVMVASPLPVTECSTAVHLRSDGRAPETIQTWDWHDDLATDALLHRLTTPDREVKLFTEFGAPAKIGVNSRGLALHFNILSHATDGDAGGVPVHAIARRILEEASTVDEAYAIAASARVSASTVFTVVDDAGEGASLEVSPAGVGVVRPNDDGWLLHTNHFLDPSLATRDAVRELSTTRQRLAHLEEQRAEMRGVAPIDRAAAMCGTAGDAAPICIAADTTLPRHERWSTLLTIALDTRSFALDYRTGTPAEAARDGLRRF